ncbi:Endoplasmic reticulum transmembrane helix translocase [Aduncisulcus paluster]|uniref:Endoplasmic reticulum transmembrane helix translocase n=1 Tax=Aduncisulcus paluster TaxID=2918883 RepID=A0ABQ5KPE5_9EUKA|nr:Endoplasmic reticulum transmembrane helix translocase [Aduncisulcus paluster]
MDELNVPMDDLEPEEIEVLDEMRGEVYKSFYLSLLYLFIPVIIHIVIILLRFWSNRYSAKTGWTLSTSKRASHVIIYPKKDCGSPAICKIKESPRHSRYIEYQAGKYLLNSDDSFVSLPYPVTISYSEVKEVCVNGGLSKEDVESKQDLFGMNEVDISVPKFGEVIKEHFMAPFFVFQIFTSVLWLLDDAKLFSLFSLFMQLVMECVSAFQSLQNRKDIVNMAPRTSLVYCLRDGRWAKIKSSLLRKRPREEEERKLAMAEAEKKRASEEKLSKLMSTITMLFPPLASSLNSNPTSSVSHSIPVLSSIVPCDCVCINGSCVVNESMLTGEATPQVKASISVVDGEKGKGEEEEEGGIEIDKQKGICLFAGTTLLQTTHSNKPIPTPNKGCLCVCVRSGGGTSQGSLFRMIAFDTEKATVNTTESLVFMVSLLIVATIAAYHVIVRGLEHKVATVPRLVLDAVLIVVSVVPPELPTVLSLSINNALRSLKKAFVFCTQPFRIPMAGSLSVACFDKTGTLTEDKVIVTSVWCSDDDTYAKSTSDKKTPKKTDKKKKIKMSSSSPECSSPSDSSKPLYFSHEPARINAECMDVIGGCHSVVVVEEEDSVSGKIKKVPSGDSLEVVSLKSTGFSLTASSTVSKTICVWGVKNKDIMRRINIMKRFPFSSALKRMSCVIGVTKGRGGVEQKKIVVKGAPDVISPLLASVPASYETQYKKLTKQGFRVLTLAWKPLDSSVNASGISRKDAEVEELSQTFKIVAIGGRGGVEQKKIVVKGAPDVISPLLASVPASYETQYKKLTKQGFRVLTLAWKPLDSSVNASGISRKDAESDLIFCGFLVITSPIKPQSRGTITNLQNSGHRCMMITGDALLTSISVAKDVNMVGKDQKLWKIVGECKKEESEELPSFVELLDEETGETKKSSDPLADGLVCISEGKALQPFLLPARLYSPLTLSLVSCLSIASRATPDDKAAIVRALRRCGEGVFCCGDGTNDVGALKNADVGIALFESADYRLQKKLENAKKRYRAQQLNPQAMYRKAGELAKQRKTSLDFELKTLYQQHKKAIYKECGIACPDDLPMNPRSEFSALLEEEEEGMLVKVGDASIAAPFTAKSGRIEDALKVVRQGRCTLVSTIQMYKVLALTSVSSAYSLSVLFLDGVRSHEYQLIVSSLASTALFYAVSDAKPLDTLASTPPPHSVLNLGVVFSIIGQAIMEMVVLIFSGHLCKEYSGVTVRKTVPFKHEFEESLTNTVLFIVQFCLDVACITVNYQGKPHTQSIFQNKKLLFSVVGSVGAVFVLASQMFPEINTMLKLKAMSNDLRWKVLGLCIAHFVICWKSTMSSPSIRYRTDESMKDTIASSPSRMRLHALSTKLSSLQSGLEEEKMQRRDAIETKLKVLDEKLSRSQLSEAAKLKLLKDQIGKLQEALATERVSREILDERKKKELGLVESSITLDLNVERQQRKDGEAKLMKSIEERVFAVRLELVKEKKAREEAEERQTREVSEEVGRIADALEQERRTRKEKYSALVRKLQDEISKLQEDVSANIQVEIDKEKEDREGTEETILKLLEETVVGVEHGLESNP